MLHPASHRDHQLQSGLSIDRTSEKIFWRLILVFVGTCGTLCSYTNVLAKPSPILVSHACRVDESEWQQLHWAKTISLRIDDFLGLPDNMTITLLWSLLSIPIHSFHAFSTLQIRSDACSESPSFTSIRVTLPA